MTVDPVPVRNPISTAQEPVTWQWVRFFEAIRKGLAAVSALTPWTQNVDAAGFDLNNVGNVAFAAGKSITQNAWAEIEPQNGWSNAGATYNSLSYRADKQRRVWIRGRLTGGTTTDNTSIGTLPAGVRPAKITGHHLLNSAGGGGTRLVIGTDGNLILYGVTSNTWIWLDGISFSLD